MGTCAIYVVPSHCKNDTGSGSVGDQVIPPLEGVVTLSIPV